MRTDQLDFPVLAFTQGIVIVARDDAQLSTANGVALRNGVYDKMQVVDRAGRAFRVVSARKLGSAGPLWGLDPKQLFTVRRYRMQLELEPEAQPASLEHVKKLVRKSFRDDPGWSSRDDFEELEAAVEAARDVPTLLELLRDRELE